MREEAKLHAFLFLVHFFFPYLWIVGRWYVEIAHLWRVGKPVLEAG